MATRTASFVYSCNTDALFRAWGVWISDGLAAFGWVLDHSIFATGTNWTDVTAPAAANTARVTEVWRMADALQATAPLFLRIEYGEMTLADFPGLRLIFATGTSGAGVMTGIIHDTGATYLGGSSLNTNPLVHYASGDTDRLTLAMNVSGTAWSANGQFTLSIERRKDGAGASVATGFLVAIKNGGQVKLLPMLATAPGGNMTLTVWPIPSLVSSAGGSIFDSKIGIHPLMYPMGVSEIGQNIVGVEVASFSVGSTFICSVLGVNVTYLATQGLGMSQPGSLGSTLMTYAIRYE